MSPYKIAVMALCVALFGGCSPNELHKSPKDSKAYATPSSNPDFILVQEDQIAIITPTDSSIDAEDIGIIKALAALDEGDLEQSIIIFRQLFETTKNPIYLKQALGITLELNRFSDLKKEDLKRIMQDIQTYLEMKPDSQDVRRTLVAIYIADKNTQQAKAEAQKLIKLEANEENYELLGSVLLVDGDMKGAQKAFRKAYSFNQSAIALERLVSVIPLKEAITLLETHVRFKGCEEKLCYILGEVYKKNKNFKRLEQIYTKQYHQDPSAEGLQALLSVLLYNKNYKKAILILEENPYYDKALLLDLYREQKDYNKAIMIAQELYTETQESKYLIIQAILEYENLKKPITKQALLPIIQKLETVIANHQADDLVYNFLGYMLIEHQIDVPAGITWVQKALEQKPHLPAYLDSLGWGYFYLKDCKKALEIFEQIPAEERNKEPEIKEHYQQVKQCVLKGKS